MKDYTIDTHTEARAKHPFWVIVLVKPVMSSVLSGEDDDMLYWCVEQFGPSGGRHAWRTTATLHERKFMFREKSSAVAFKVRWG